ncbi:GlsB/YeaQ/YmgE family stress response membrane protein [Lactobacillus crispatus]|uniref:GlsB/YeaQ/YmgE family stress response membrane protein n=1 Tax=Lactobacillus crispatus TaxID=47770 RepID=A0A6A1Z4J2_9LACO|nr:GlsB/YeaQ/YmgE family stress response membrane protein [Lactobacillus crispatus]KAB1969367.1 GlsB/YeaQ/YmgE family stress response membrane protein [Lactobacillus crispatus]MCT3538591.1 GlsB/YeaQ/YmgE family stress response membrane protein [Lactobacillus crispatus]
MLLWIWVLIVGAIIGLIAGFITGKGGSMGFLANLIAGLVGSTLGQAIFGSWGPQMAGMAIVPSILGAVILVLVVSFVLGMLRKTE